jgi:hypothetical protein
VRPSASSFGSGSKNSTADDRLVRACGVASIEAMASERSIHNVRVRTRSKIVSLPWESAQDFVGRALAAYPTVHPVVEQFRAGGVSRPLELLDPNHRTFCLAVIEAWSAQIGTDELPPGIPELRDALRDNSRST